MKPNPQFIRFASAGKEHVGFVLGGSVYSLTYSSMLECIVDDFEFRGKREADSTKIKTLPPVNPSKIICLGWNYKAHNKELKAKAEKPIIFLKPSSAVVGHQQDIIYPSFTKQLEHEVELGVVIKKKGKKIRKENAMDYVAGYTIVLDMTARDLQWALREKGDPWDVCKGFDTSAPIGPGIVPKRYVSDPDNLELTLWVNGKVRQHSNTSDMINRIPEIIEYVSTYFTLEAGDIIATGTPEGVGPVKIGDVVEAEIEGIGTMRNKIIKEK